MQADDAVRLAKLMVTPIKIGILAVLLGAALILSMQWANPIPFNAGPGATGHFGYQSAADSAYDRQVKERTEDYLAQFEARRATTISGGGPMESHPLP